MRSVSRLTRNSTKTQLWLEIAREEKAIGIIVGYQEITGRPYPVYVFPDNDLFEEIEMIEFEDKVEPDFFAVDPKNVHSK